MFVCLDLRIEESQIDYGPIVNVPGLAGVLTEDDFFWNPGLSQKYLPPIGSENCVYYSIFVASCKII